MVLTDALEESGIMVVVAQNGERGLDLAGRVMPDIILMDAIMPGMDGFETCRRLKQRNDLAHIPVVFMTGLSETETYRQRAWRRRCRLRHQTPGSR